MGRERAGRVERLQRGGRQARRSMTEDRVRPGGARAAIVHDWLTGMRGGERVLEALLELLPDADLFTLLHVPGSVSPRIEARPIHTSFVQRLPAAGTHYRRYLPLFPRAIERFDLSAYDLVLSSSHCVAKGARARDDALHVCYCHTPMRYVWDQYSAYFGRGRASPPVRLAMGLLAPRLRAWDRATAARVNTFVANSANVARRVRRWYDRDAQVVHPPVDIDRFVPAYSRDAAYIVLSALVPYKRIDCAIDAFNRLGRRLLVLGTGPERARLERRAGPSISFLGHLPDAEVAALLGRCRALVQPGEEDFGIASVEAQAAGAPVIALGAGGALETVIDPDVSADDATGILFAEPAAASLIDAVHRFEATTFRIEALRANARRFTRERFLRGMRAVLSNALER
jgi:glycosyltransferase involved in cell wall biosynthesis